MSPPKLNEISSFTKIKITNLNIFRNKYYYAKFKILECFPHRTSILFELKLQTNETWAFLTCINCISLKFICNLN